MSGFVNVRENYGSVPDTRKGYHYISGAARPKCSDRACPCQENSQALITTYSLISAGSCGNDTLSGEFTGPDNHVPEMLREATYAWPLSGSFTGPDNHVLSYISGAEQPKM